MHIDWNAVWFAAKIYLIFNMFVFAWLLGWPRFKGGFMAEVRNYQVSCLGKLSRSYHADTEQEARDIALSWVRDGRGEEALCFCVQNGQVGPRPFASYRR